MVPVEHTLKPSKHSDADDTDRIQEALDAVGRLPVKPMGKDGARIRGAVLLKAGTYRVAGALIINSSGVVLRGEGQDKNGTIIVATGKIQRDFILVNAMLNSTMGSVKVQRSKAKTVAMSPRNAYRPKKKPDTHTRPGIYIPVGSTEIPVLSTEGYSVGDRIIIERPASKAWISDIGMDKLPPRPDTKEPSMQWTPRSYTFSFERKIVAVDNATKTLTIDIPMVMSLDPKYTRARIAHLAYKHRMISDVGVENLHLVSETDPKDPEDENHGWYGVVIDNTVNGWISGVKTSHFVSGIFASYWSRFITIQDCSVVEPVSKPHEGGRRYHFNLSGQMGLVKRCFSNKARHDFISQGRACDSTGEDSNNESGPHERWTMGTLYDNVKVNILRIRQRSWMGVYHVVYNCEAKTDVNHFQDAPGAVNWIIGFKGNLSEPQFEGKISKMISHNSRVHPRSLYWSQLAVRKAVDVLKLAI
ncbi:hypothetical protein BGZ72_006500 [Mortierella alpina]|nr:hypothetical protein BGZ72_006500 [Mortierella alpina]